MKRLLFLLPLLVGVGTSIGILTSSDITKLQKPTAPTILLYNHIEKPPASAKDFNSRYLYVSPSALNGQIGYLKSHGFTFLSRDQSNAITDKKAQAPKKAVILLFRDAYTDVAVNALPVLQKYHVPAVIFFPANDRGQPGFMTVDQVLTADNNNVYVAQPNPFLLYNPNLRQEVSGVIAMPQFTDLLPEQTFDTKIDAIAIGIIALLITAFALLIFDWAILLPVVLLPTYLIRFTLFGIPATFLELTVLIIIGVAAIRYWRPLLTTIKTFPYLYPVILFLIASFIATAAANDHIAALGGLKAYVIEPILYSFVLLSIGSKERAAKRIFYAIVISCLSISLISLAQYSQGEFYVTQNLEKLTTFFGNPNYLATFLSVGIVIAIGFLLQAKTLTFRFMWLVVLTTLVPSFLLAKSDTANLGVAAAAILLLIYAIRDRINLPKSSPLLYIAVVILGSLGLFLAIVSPKGQTFLKQHKLGTLTSRFYIYQTAIKIITDHPITGVGLLNFNKAYVVNVSEDATEQNVALAHNTMLDFWTQMGLFGLAAYLWMIIRYFRIGIMHASNKIYPILLACMLAFLVHGMLDSQYHKNDYSIIFWTLLALSAMPLIGSHEQPKKLKK